MRHRFLVWTALSGIILLLAISLFPVLTPASNSAVIRWEYQREAPQYVPGEIIVELRQEVRDSFWQELGIDSENIERLDKYVSIASLAANQTHIQRSQEEPIRELPRSQHLIHVPEDDEAAMLERLLNDDRVLHAERVVAWAPCDVPTDPLWDKDWQGVFFGQWGPKKLEIPRATDRTKGRGPNGDRPVVGIIDTGFEKSHDDLKANFDSRSRDFTQGGSPEHGTRVAGVIGAPWNGLGVAGECPDALMMFLGCGLPPDVNNPQGLIHSGAALEALNYFIAQNPQGGVVNMSFGGPGMSQAMLNVINASPVLVIAGAGNNAVNPTEIIYPAGLNQFTRKVIAVAASNPDDTLALGTSYGYADVAAPGNGLLTTAPGNTWGGISLTSAAAASCSGVAALIWHQEGGDPLRVANQLFATVDISLHWQGKVKTSGRINAARAAWSERNPAPPLTATFDKLSYQAAETQPVTFSLVVSNPEARVTWTFGDEAIVTGSFSITHIYQKLGQYTVKADVTDGINGVTATAGVTVTDFVTLRIKRKAGGAKLVLKATSSQQRQSSPALILVEAGAPLRYNPNSDVYELKVKTNGLPASLTVRSSLGGEATQFWRWRY